MPEARESDTLQRNRWIPAKQNHEKIFRGIILI